MSESYWMSRFLSENERADILVDKLDQAYVENELLQKRLAELEEQILALKEKHALRIL